MYRLLISALAVDSIGSQIIYTQQTVSLTKGAFGAAVICPPVAEPNVPVSSPLEEWNVTKYFVNAYVTMFAVGMQLCNPRDRERLSANRLLGCKKLSG